VKRSAFSLLEIIIATAVLAASAMVLSSLIGLGSKFGNRAEERTLAMSQAESLLDEYLAGLGRSDNRLEETTGELPGPPVRGYRISAAPVDLGNGNSNQASSTQSSASANSTRSGLLRVTVVLFETAGNNSTGQNSTGQGKALIELSRLVRQPQPATDPMSTDPMASGIQTGAAQEFDASLGGQFP
jgi:type II secretory pathway pseudopilin PulG